MSFNSVSYTSMQQIPDSTIHFNILYNKGDLSFQFAMRDLKELFANYDITNTQHEDILRIVIRLMTVEDMYFSHLGDAETWLREVHGLSDLQWQLRRVDDVKPVYEDVDIQLGIDIVQYPSLDGGYVRVAKKSTNQTAYIIGFSDAPFLTMPMEIMTKQFKYTV